MAAEKIKQLRAWMSSKNLDAYLVPHADRFQSEYLTERDERLAWLTGFTGSNGFAIILQKKAALFTDGRYTLQAPKQVDTKVIDIFESPPARPSQYLADEIKENMRVGFDPWLFTVTQGLQFKKIAKDFGWKLVAVEENGIDAIWKDRPKEEIIAAETHMLDYAGVETDEKIKQIIEKMSAEAESILVSEPGLVCWMLNLRGRDVTHTPVLHSMALVDESGHTTLFTDPRKITDSVRRTLGNHVSIEDLSNIFQVLDTQEHAIQIDPNETPFAIKEYCRKKKLPVIMSENPASLLRALKNPVEVKGAQTAHQKDKKAFAAFLEWFNGRDFAKEKITELDIVAKLRECRAQDPDFIDDSFSTIAGYGPNGAIVHYFPTKESNLRLKNGSLLLLDSGAQYKVGTTDVTRTLAVGETSAIMKKHYTAVLKGTLALSAARFVKGTTGAQLEVLARMPVWTIGMNYGHGTGHGVGSFMAVHEGPQRFSSQSHVPLQAGMILSIEPGIYITDEYGIRLENLVVVIDDKKPDDAQEMLAFRTLTKIPFDASMIEWQTLSTQEIMALEAFDTHPPKN